MEQETPPQRPEGALIEAAQKASGLSIRKAADRAGMSDGRWRQIVKGSMQVQGTSAIVVAPAHALARMAVAVNVSAQQMREAGREDAANLIEKLGDKFRAMQFNAETPQAREQQSVTQINDEIEMIYASQSMSAQQKLDAIRMVLQLRAQVDAETAQGKGRAFDATVITTQPAPTEN